MFFLSFLVLGLLIMDIALKTAIAIWDESRGKFLEDSEENQF